MGFPYPNFSVGPVYGTDLFLRIQYLPFGRQYFHSAGGVKQFTLIYVCSETQPTATGNL